MMSCFFFFLTPPSRCHSNKLRQNYPWLHLKCKTRKAFLRQEGCCCANSITKGLDIPECTSVLPNDSTQQAPPIRAPPVASLITSPNHRVYAGGPRFILDELHGMKEDTLGDFLFFCLQLKLFSCCGFSFTSARTHMALFIRSLLPVMSSSKQNSRWCGWHPGNWVESCNGAAALQQLRLWSHKSDLNRGREQSEAKRHVLPQWNCLLMYIAG